MSCLTPVWFLSKTCTSVLPMTGPIELFTINRAIGGDKISSAPSRGGFSCSGAVLRARILSFASVTFQADAFELTFVMWVWQRASCWSLSWGSRWTARFVGDVCGSAPGSNPAASSLSFGYDLTIYGAASSPRTLTIMLMIAVIGMPFVVAYTPVIYRVFCGKVRLESRGY
jgi:cytochrome bd-type quinol oxidase subunit 2